EQARPPGFVMWAELPEDEHRTWQRQWFGHELVPEAAFNVRGIGIREPLFNPNVSRPMGTGDWLIMLFHKAPRLEPHSAAPSHGPKTLVLWPPGAAQFYSWGKAEAKEPHSWIHVEGTWVAQQVETLDLPVNTPFSVPDETVMISSLVALFREMQLGPLTDRVILQNLFENFARGIRRQLQPETTTSLVPPAVLRVRRQLDADFRRIPPLDELAELAAMSRSHLCHRFRECFGSSISEYVIRKRMAAAQRMLYEVDLRPGEIAEAVGYPDIFQFSKQFKKTFGVSPTDYRKREIQDRT
ncbi:MAG: AraC family transcriptional regulator, partial [Verrucomicrobiota bacterium]